MIYKSSLYSFIPLMLLILWTIICLGIRAFIQWRRTGHHGIVVSESKGAHRYVGRMLLFMISIFGILGGIFSLSKDFYEQNIPVFNSLIGDSWQISGLVLVFLSIFFCFLAQLHMQDSWRVGIDKGTKTELVNRGIYRYSRNPIYVAMLVAVIGFFLLLPSWVSLFLIVISYILIHIQILLEEEFLESLHGEIYIVYCRQVRRWL